MVKTLLDKHDKLITCPECGSLYIKYTTLQNGEMGYRCNSCGHVLDDSILEVLHKRW